MFGSLIYAYLCCDPSKLAIEYNDFVKNTLDNDSININKKI
jgi:hypothetical protein